jgi:hypothetical protein
MTVTLTSTEIDDLVREKIEEMVVGAKATDIEWVDGDAMVTVVPE